MCFDKHTACNENVRLPMYIYVCISIEFEKVTMCMFEHTLHAPHVDI